MALNCSLGHVLKGQLLKQCLNQNTILRPILTTINIVGCLHCQGGLQPRLKTNSALLNFKSCLNKYYCYYRYRHKINTLQADLEPC